GVIDVTSGDSLTIEPGTLVIGDGNNRPSALIIRAGAYINATGLDTLPIVFSSDRPKNQRAPGDWGGVAIIGDAPANCSPCNVEGLTGGDALTYGGSDPTDNSGILKYVRIEYAGYILDAATGNELNGLSLYSVGSGTTLDHIQVHYGSDDGF